MADLRFNLRLNNKRYINIPDESVTELTNLISAAKTYRLKTIIEYEEQLKLSEKLINSLTAHYKL